MNNILILMANSPEEMREITDYHEGKCLAGTVTFASIFSNKKSKILRGIRRVCMHNKIIGGNFWLGDWFGKLDTYDTIIAVAYRQTYNIMKYIQKRYPQIRRILYWYDPAWSIFSPDLVDQSICECWSFSEYDAQKYGLRYNGQFWMYPFDKQELIGKMTVFKYDIVFLGSGMRGYEWRTKVLTEIKEHCSLEMSLFLGLWYGSSGTEKPFALDRYYSNKEYKELVDNSKCIVDIVQPDQYWMTLRPLQALFWGKKLITNNIAIIKEPLYKKSNIFVIGKDSWDEFLQWFNIPFAKLDDSIYEHYLVDSWIKRFE